MIRFLLTFPYHFLPEHSGECKAVQNICQALEPTKISHPTYEPLNTNPAHMTTPDIPQAFASSAEMEEDEPYETPAVEATVWAQMQTIVSEHINRHLDALYHEIRILKEFSRLNQVLGNVWLDDGELKTTETLTTLAGGTEDEVAQHPEDELELLLLEELDRDEPNIAVTVNSDPAPKRRAVVETSQEPVQKSRRIMEKDVEGSNYAGPSMDESKVSTDEDRLSTGSRSTWARPTVESTPTTLISSVSYTTNNGPTRTSHKEAPRKRKHGSAQSLQSSQHYRLVRFIKHNVEALLIPCDKAGSKMRGPIGELIPGNEVTWEVNEMLIKIDGLRRDYHHIQEAIALASPTWMPDRMATFWGQLGAFLKEHDGYAD